MNEQSSSHDSPAKPRWQPLAAIDRRIAGVLVEKAKTTPSAYPMSLNAIAAAANQKSNRDPIMEIEPEDAEESLERLRGLGAVGLIEGHGRVAKYRHYLYEWLGVDKIELAVMAELLLRGPQTEGELRGRASRMESIADLPALRDRARFAQVERARPAVDAGGSWARGHPRALYRQRAGTNQDGVGGRAAGCG